MEALSLFPINVDVRIVLFLLSPFFKAKAKMFAFSQFYYFVLLLSFSRDHHV